MGVAWAWKAMPSIVSNVKNRAIVLMQFSSSKRIFKVLVYINRLLDRRDKGIRNGQTMTSI